MSKPGQLIRDKEVNQVSNSGESIASKPGKPNKREASSKNNVDEDKASKPGQLSRGENASEPSQPDELGVSKPGQPVREDNNGQPGLPIDITPTATDGKYYYFTRSQVAEYLQLKPQNITDGLLGKSKPIALLLKQNGFEKVSKPVKGIPKNASIRKVISPHFLDWKQQTSAFLDEVKWDE